MEQRADKAGVTPRHADDTTARPFGGGPTRQADAHGTRSQDTLRLPWHGPGKLSRIIAAITWRRNVPVEPAVMAQRMDQGENGSQLQRQGCFAAYYARSMDELSGRIQPMPSEGRQRWHYDTPTSLTTGTRHLSVTTGLQGLLEQGHRHRIRRSRRTVPRESTGLRAGGSSK